jgi:dTDP-glucose 4,6-dehydratase
MKEHIGPIDYIIHLAAISDVFWGQDNPVYTVENNVRSTLTMYEYAKATPHEAFVYFSTDEVYGPVLKGESHKEWDAHRPSNFYSASKAMGEDLGYAYWRNGDVKLIITNTMNNIGEWQSDTKFPVKVQRALEKNEVVTIHGSPKEIGSRFYIHSKRVAHALLDILSRPVHLHQQGTLDEPDRYHIVSNSNLDNLELAQKIADLMGKELHYVLQDFHTDNPAHDIHYGLANTKLQIPDTFEEDLKATIDFQAIHQ